MRPSQHKKVKNIDPGDVEIQIIPMGKTAIPLAVAHNPFNSPLQKKDDSGKKKKKKVR